MRVEPNELPNGWATRTIGECCDILDSRRVPINEDERFLRKGPIPYYGANGQQGWIDDFLFDEELVLIAEDGGLFDEYSTRPIAYRISGKSWVNNHAHILRANNETTNEWVFYNLVHEDIRRYISGGTRAKLTQNELRRVEVPFPEKPEQSRVAAVLDMVDEAIAKAEALIAKLRQLRAGLLHDLLTRGLDHHGQLRDPIAHPEQFQDSPLGRIPKEWEAKKLSGLCNHIGSGVTPRGGQDVYTSTGIMLIRSQNVAFEGLLLEDAAFIPEEIHLGMLRSEVFAHDVLFNITGASIGRCCPMPEGLGTANVNQHVCALRLPKATSTDAKYLASLLASPIGQRQMDSLLTVGNRQGLNYQQLGSFLISWPGEDEREAISSKICGIEDQISAEEKEHGKLALLKSGLMTDLLTGRVRVPETVGTTS